jgi:aspartate carbamoyltransferase catalytic subunit
MQNYPGWNDFCTLPLEARLEHFKRDSQLFDLLYAQQFDRPTLEALFSLGDRIRGIAKTKKGMDFLQTVLSDKRAMLFFVQPSTRTFLSFLNACQTLGMDTCEIRDASTSSEIKGESEEDTIRTFSSYVDLIITRHVDEGFAEKAAWVLNTHAKRSVPVINGGSGKDQHPTQALLDMYTLFRAFTENDGIDGKHIVMVGDLKRGRTVRSLCRLLALYKDISISFVSPDEFAMREDILALLDAKNIRYTQTNDLNQALPQADAVYTTRIQDEYDEDGESLQVDTTPYNLTKAHLSLMKKECVILHPFPRRGEVSVEIDQDPRAFYWKQARNGMWARIALIVTLFRRESVIWDYPL